MQKETPKILLSYIIERPGDSNSRERAQILADTIKEAAAIFEEKKDILRRMGSIWTQSTVREWSPKDDNYVVKGSLDELL